MKFNLDKRGSAKGGFLHAILTIIFLVVGISAIVVVMQRGSNDSQRIEDLNLVNEMVQKYVSEFGVLPSPGDGSSQCHYMRALWEELSDVVGEETMPIDPSDHGEYHYVHNGDEYVLIATLDDDESGYLDSDYDGDFNGVPLGMTAETVIEAGGSAEYFENYFANKIHGCNCIDSEGTDRYNRYCLKGSVNISN